MTKRRVLLGVSVLLAVLAAGYMVARIHDARLARFSEGDLRDLAEQHLSTNSDIPAVQAFLEELRTHPPDSATIEVYPAETTKEHWSLVDRGVEPGLQVIVVSVENELGWLPTVCTDEYLAYFVFNTSLRYSRLLFQNAGACI